MPMKYSSFIGLEHEVSIDELDKLCVFVETLDVDLELEYYDNCVYAVIDIDTDVIGTMYFEMEFGNYSWEEYNERKSNSS